MYLYKQTYSLIVSRRIAVEDTLFLAVASRFVASGEALNEFGAINMSLVLWSVGGQAVILFRESVDDPRGSSVDDQVPVVRGIFWAVVDRRSDYS